MDKTHTLRRVEAKEIVFENASSKNVSNVIHSIQDLYKI